MHNAFSNNIFNLNASQQSHAVVNSANETFSAKRRRLLSTPLALAPVTTNLLHTTGGTISAFTPDVGTPAASFGLGSSDEMEWLTRMFHPPN